ncbi:MAG: HEAT repeat domain-containing protein [Chloroflexota bacterium]
MAERTRDTDPAVRALAVCLMAHARPDPATVLPFLEDPDPRVRARTAAALYALGEAERAQEALDQLLVSPDEAQRLAALEAIAEVKKATGASRWFEFLNDPSPAIRAAAARGLARHESPQALQALLELLDDESPQLRQAATVALRAASGAAASLLRLLQSGTERAQDAALDALEGRGAEVGEGLLAWAADEFNRAAQLRGWHSSLRPAIASPAIDCLQHVLQTAEWQAEVRVLRALALLHGPRPVSLIARALQQTDGETRAQALEALDALGDTRLARPLVRLLEEPSPSANGLQVEAALRALALHPRPWIRALAVYAQVERLGRELAELSSRARVDPSPLVRQTAERSRLTAGGFMAETSATLGTIERVLCLRRVPIFQQLAPEDLQRLADVAEERLFPPGEYLCREGDVGEELFILVEGRVRVVKAANGATRTLRQLQAGDYIGELAILRQQPRSASVIAEGGSVRVLAIGGPALKAILSDRPEVALSMLTSLAERPSTLV